MTSGRIPCSDCGRNSPQGRHASCHVLTLLRGANGDRFWSKRDLLRAVYPHRWNQIAPGERPDLSPIEAAITSLRKAGWNVICWQGMVKLRQAVERAS